MCVVANGTAATRAAVTTLAANPPAGGRGDWRGFGCDAIKRIMTRVVTHVGVNDISTEQWIAVALRYAAQLAEQPAS